MNFRFTHVPHNGIFPSAGLITAASSLSCVGGFSSDAGLPQAEKAFRRAVPVDSRRALAQTLLGILRLADLRSCLLTKIPLLPDEKIPFLKKIVRVVRIYEESPIERANLRGNIIQWNSRLFCHKAIRRVTILQPTLFSIELDILARGYSRGTFRHQKNTAQTPSSTAAQTRIDLDTESEITNDNAVSEAVPRFNSLPVFVRAAAGSSGGRFLAPCRTICASGRISDEHRTRHEKPAAPQIQCETFHCRHMACRGHGGKELFLPRRQAGPQYRKPPARLRL